MTLEQHLAAGYKHASHGGTDPAPEVAKAVPRETLTAEAARLDAVKDRCHISRVRLKFIQRVLALPH